jgi:hypothetical protein
LLIQERFEAVETWIPPCPPQGYARSSISKLVEKVDILVLPLDEGGAWKHRLAREMRAADVPLDADAVLQA